MKTQQLPAFIIAFFFLSLCCDGQTYVEIRYHSEEAKGAKYFTTPLQDGSYILAKRFQATPDSIGLVRLKINLKKPGILYANAKSRLIEIYLEPSKNIYVDIGERVVFRGDLKKENALLYRFARVTDENGLSSIEKSLFKVESSKAFSDSLTLAIERDVKILEQVGQETKKSSPQFIDFISYNIRLYYHSKAAYSLTLKSDRNRRNKRDDNIKNPEWDRVRHELFTTYLINCNLSNSYWYSDYLSKYMQYLWSINGAEFINNAESTKRTTLLTNQYLSGVSKEIFISNYISLYTKLGTTFYTQEMIDFFDQFKKEFSHSSSISVLEPKINEVIQYLTVDASTRMNGINFIDDFKNIARFETLMKRFAGKVVLIDIWATWCLPCIEEFQHYGQINDLAERKTDFAVLFISRDKISDEQRWRKFIASKNLLGFHIIPNDSLQKELGALINWGAIPRYLIVNKEGRIVNPDAPGPSSGKVLTDELSKYLN